MSSSEEIPAATATLDIAKSPEIVRAQFFDMDHAIRGRVHHGVVLRWLPPKAPNELRVEQTMNVMMRTQVEIFVIEEADDGSWVKRIVDGTNVGTRFVASFTATPGDEVGTRVRLQAFTGKGGYMAGLGKLSQLGLEKALQKTLDEHKRALEGYEPGRARGAVRAVIASMRDPVALAAARADGQMRAVMSNFLEAACVVAVANASADDAERDAILEVARTLCSLDLDDEAVARMVENVGKAARSEGVEARCDKIGARLASMGLAEIGVRVAALVAQVSHGIDAPELVTLQRLANASGVGEERLRTLIHEIDMELSKA